MCGRIKSVIDDLSTHEAVSESDHLLFLEVARLPKRWAQKRRSVLIALGRANYQYLDDHRKFF